MIRNLKVLVAAAMALAAFGAVSASSSQAALFHCSAEPCVGVLKPDETANTKTSHHVFIIENAAKTESVSFTCGQLTGRSKTATKTSETQEAGNSVALSYDECFVNGSGAVTVDMNECKYNFTASGTVTITGCNSKKQIEITKTNCTYDIPEQGPLSTISYHNIGTSPNREVTVSTNVTGIKISAVTGTAAECFINPSQTLTGTYTTGNTIVTGQSEAGAMADAWWE